MSKELTEKWKNGELEQRYYYVQYNGNPKPFVEIELKNFLLDLVKVKDRDTIEVLAPVPTYEEYQKLKEQLADAEEVIKWYNGLEDILIGWEICTGQQKGTAKKYLDKWGVK